MTEQPQNPREKLEEIRDDLSRAERGGSPEITFYGYVGYKDVAWLVRTLLNTLKENERLKMGYGRELRGVEAELAPALGYPWAEDYGWVVGDHSTVSLAMEARRRFEELEGALRFYADETNYLIPSMVDRDLGEVARAILQEQSPGEAYREYSDEDIRRWEEADKLDPEMAEWLKTQAARHQEREK